MHFYRIENGASAYIAEHSVYFGEATVKVERSEGPEEKSIKNHVRM